MRIVIFGTHRKTEYRCGQCGRWVLNGFCEDHPHAKIRVYDSYELDDDKEPEESYEDYDARVR